MRGRGPKRYAAEVTASRGSSRISTRRCGDGSVTSNTPRHSNFATLIVSFDGGCVPSCASRTSGPGSDDAKPTIRDGLTLSSRIKDCSPLQQPLHTRDIPDEETSNWRAVCGKTARTVRREGRPKAFPTPIPLIVAPHTGSAIEYFTWLNAKLDSIEAMPSSRVSLVFRNAS